MKNYTATWIFYIIIWILYTSDQVYKMQIISYRPNLFQIKRKIKEHSNKRDKAYECVVAALSVINYELAGPCTIKPSYRPY